MPGMFTKTWKQGLTDIDFSQSDILQLLQKVNITKSPGPDQVHPRVLRECANELAEPLTIPFRESLNIGRLPTTWKEGNITPIFKKGSRSDVNNYRPVSLTCICCKLMEKIIRKALLQHLSDNELLSARFCWWSVMLHSASADY